MAMKPLYAIRDNTAGSFHPPFIASNNKEAIRILTNMVNSGQNLLATNPEDFTLYNLGSIELESGEITQMPTDVRILLHAVDCVASPAD